MANKAVESEADEANMKAKANEADKVIVTADVERLLWLTKPI